MKRLANPILLIQIPHTSNQKYSVYISHFRVIRGSLDDGHAGRDKHAHQQIRQPRCRGHGLCILGYTHHCYPDCHGGSLCISARPSSSLVSAIISSVHSVFL